MIDLRRALALLVLSVSLVPLACSGEGDAEGEEPVSVASEELVASDTVAKAVGQSCTTTAVKGLATQLVEEIQCLRPNTLARIDKTPGLALGPAVFPYLQTNAAKALGAAQKARGTTLSINSALRTLPQQYLLYRWYQTGRCGIGLAASPGTSNHEGAIAVDINDSAGWRASLQGKGFRWLGASDPVHYDFTGGGTVNLRGLSVKAFQRLWNRNHPTDKIPEDGAYGGATADRLARSPIGGFPKGAYCTQAKDGGADAANADAGDDDAPDEVDVPEVPDADEGGDTTPAAATPSPSEVAPLAPHATPADAGGCTASPRTRLAGPPRATLVLGALAALAALARRKRYAGRACGSRASSPSSPRA